MKLEDLALKYGNLFLDMDGVLCDFTTGVVSGIYGRSDTRPTAYSISKHLGTTDEEMWRRVTAQGSLFWENLPDFPATERLVSLAKSHPRCVILTSPSRCASSRLGKIRWLQRHGLDHLELIFAPCGKSKFLTGCDSLLIDDFKKNVDEWCAEGGDAVHWAQPWSQIGDIQPAFQPGLVYRGCPQSCEVELLPSRTPRVFPLMPALG